MRAAPRGAGDCQHPSVALRKPHRTHTASSSCPLLLPARAQIPPIHRSLPHPFADPFMWGMMWPFMWYMPYMWYFPYFSMWWPWTMMWW